MTVAVAPLCATCRRLRIGDDLSYSCSAFPKGIPNKILLNEKDHREPVQGDHGITYRPLRKGDPVFDPFEHTSLQEAYKERLHPRDRLGRWREKVGSLHTISKADVIAGKVPGFKYKPDMSPGIAARFEREHIAVGPGGFEGETLGTLLMTHEIGHAVQQHLFATRGKNGIDKIPEVQAFRKEGQTFTRGYGYAPAYDNPFGASERPEEMVADAYSWLLHYGLWGDREVLPGDRVSGPGFTTGEVGRILNGRTEAEVTLPSGETKKLPVASLSHVDEPTEDFPLKRAALLKLVAKAARELGLPDKRMYRYTGEGSERITEAYVEGLHPRDRLGRWIEKADLPKLLARPTLTRARYSKVPEDVPAQMPKLDRIELSDGEIEAASSLDLWNAYALMGEADDAAQADRHAAQMDRIAAELDRRLEQEERGSLTYADVGGEHHVHTTYSDGHHSIEQIAQRAQARGLKFVVISDHSHHLTPETLAAQHAEIDAANKRFPDLRIVKGIEANIRLDGTLDVPDAVLETLEHVNIGAHEVVDTAAILKAMENPHVTTLAHPHAADLDFEAIAVKARERGVALEVNGRNMLRKNRERAATALIVAALKNDVPLQIAGDGHRRENLLDTRYALAHARRLGVTRAHLLRKHVDVPEPEYADDVSEPEGFPLDPAVLKVVKEYKLDSEPQVFKGDRSRWLFGDLEDTTDLYLVNGEWTPARAQVHSALIEDLLRGYSPTGEQPVALFTAGGGASGKSAGLRLRPHLIPPGAVPVNPDTIKMLLPEWDFLTSGDEPDPYTAHALHEESSYIAARLLDEAYKRGLNVLVDAVGDAEKGKFAAKLKRAKENGYRVRVLFADAALNTAIERNVRRGMMEPGGIDEQRVVPIAVQKHTHREAIKRIEDWWDSADVDEWHVWRTSDLAEPELVAEGGQGKRRIVSRKQWRAMQKKARGG